MATTKEDQEKMTPAEAIALLKSGNKSFAENKRFNRDLSTEVKQTSTGQYPFATVLHCIDSRVSAELIFDQGVGDLFSVRIAGNFVNDHILGSMEFASTSTSREPGQFLGTKVIVVLGHTACGAIKGACDTGKESCSPKPSTDTDFGNLITLLCELRPAVEAVKEPTEASERTSKNSKFVNDVATENVFGTIDNIKERSSVLRQMEKDGLIKIVGAMYDIETGKVDFDIKRK